MLTISENTAISKQSGSRNVKVSHTQRLIESALLIAMGTVLSLIKIIDLPYGGSVTVASMLPVMIIAYRHGLGYGLVSAAVFGGIQQLLGLKTLSWVSTWQSVLAVIFLDYVIAFAVIGFGGIFRRKLKDQALELSLGAVLVCALRYLCHFVSGVTVWTGFALPTMGAVVYSFAYNATYMLPEMIVMTVTAYFLGSSLDFRFSTPVRVKKTGEHKVPVFGILSLLVVAATIITDVALIFGKLQNADTGEWYLGGLKDVNWTAVIIVTAAGLILAAVLMLIDKEKREKDSEFKA